MEFLKENNNDIDEFFNDADFIKKLTKRDIKKEKPKKRKESPKRTKKVKQEKSKQFNISEAPRKELNSFTELVLDNTVSFNRKNHEDYIKPSFKHRLKREKISFYDGKILIKRLIHESMNNENFNYGKRLQWLFELFKANRGSSRHPTHNIFKEIYNADYHEEENIIQYRIGSAAEYYSKKELEEKNKKLQSDRLMKRYGYDKKSNKNSTNNQKKTSASKNKPNNIFERHVPKSKGIDYDKINKFIERNLTSIEELNNLVLNTPPYYLSKKHRDDLLDKYSNIFNELNNMRLSDNSISIIELSSKNCDLSKIKCDLKVLKDFIKINNDLLQYMGLEEYFINNLGQRISRKKNYIRLANERYVQKELENNKELFDDLFDDSDDKKKVSLDEYQRRAVVIDEDNTQIIAGAGTGKTLTLQAKLKYLTKVKCVKEENILCLSYSKASVEDLEEKVLETLGENQVDIRTFHSLGSHILRYNDEDNRIYKGALDEVIENYFKKNIMKDSEKIKEIIKFFSYYFYVPISELECKILDKNSKEYQEKGKFQINKENKTKISYGEKIKKENTVILETFKDKVGNFLRGFDDKSRFEEFRKSLWWR